MSTFTKFMKGSSLFRGKTFKVYATALASTTFLLLSTQASAFVISINGETLFQDPSSGSVSVFTQINPNVISVGPFSSTDVEGSIGVVGTFSAGSRRRTDFFFFFELPTVSSSADILSASASLGYLSKADAPSYNIDLWGLGFTDTGVIDPAWRLFGNTDSDPGVGVASRTKIQDNLITPGLAPPTTALTDAAGNATFVTFLQSLYDAGAEGGDLAIFRLNPDAFLNPSSGGTPAYRLQIVQPPAVTAVPEPSALSALGVGLVLLGLMRRRRGETRIQLAFR